MISGFCNSISDFNSCHSQHAIYILAVLSELKFFKQMPYALVTVHAISSLECTSSPYEQRTFIHSFKLSSSTTFSVRSPLTTLTPFHSQS